MAQGVEYSSLIREQTQQEFDSNAPEAMRIPSVFDVLADFRQRDVAEIPFPERAWYANPEFADSNHGIGHVGRFGLYLFIFAHFYDFSEQEFKIARVIGLTHDVRRETLIPEIKHGEAAGNWVAESEEAATLRVGLTYEELEAVRQVNTYHNISWRNIPQEILEKHGRLIKIVKYVDALDRYRDDDPNVWLKEEYFSPETPEEEEFLYSMFSFAKYLTRTCLAKQQENGWSDQEAVIAIGRKTGIIKTEIISDNLSTDVFTD